MIVLLYTQIQRSVSGREIVELRLLQQELSLAAMGQHD